MIIGIAGTLGAGKGTVVQYLVEHKGFTHLSVRNFLWEEVDRRCLPRVRDHLSLVANDLRATHGAGYISGELFKRAENLGTDVIIESLHTLGETAFLRQHGAVIFGVDADIQVRYKRIQGRATETDQVTFEKFKEDNEREIASKDPAQHNIQAVIDSADFVFTNNGTLEELHAQVEEALERIQKA